MSRRWCTQTFHVVCTWYAYCSITCQAVKRPALNLQACIFTVLTFGLKIETLINVREGSTFNRSRFDLDCTWAVRLTAMLCFDFQRFALWTMTHSKHSMTSSSSTRYQVSARMYWQKTVQRTTNSWCWCPKKLRYPTRKSLKYLSRTKRYVLNIWEKTAIKYRLVFNSWISIASYELK